MKNAGWLRYIWPLVIAAILLAAMFLFSDEPSHCYPRSPLPFQVDCQRL